MLQAYMDDSGSHDSSHNCVVGGYWGGVNKWRCLEREWNATLSDFEIEEFKARTFFRRVNGKRVAPYSDWTENVLSLSSRGSCSQLAERKFTRSRPASLAGNGPCNHTPIG